jgi:hypothetical protein
MRFFEWPNRVPAAATFNNHRQSTAIDADSSLVGQLPPLIDETIVDVAAASVHGIRLHILQYGGDHKKKKKKYKAMIIITQ